MSRYKDVIMGTMAFHISIIIIVYSSVYSGADHHQRKHQSFASLAFVWGSHRWPVNYPHKWPVKRKIFPFDFVIVKCLRLKESHYAGQWIKLYNIRGKKTRIIFHLWIKLFQAWWRICTSLNMVVVGLGAKSLAEPVLNYWTIRNKILLRKSNIFLEWRSGMNLCIAVEAVSSHKIFSTLFLRRLTIFLSQALIHHRRYE